MESTPQENAALVRGFLTDVVVGGDTDAVEAFLTDSVRTHNLVFGDGHGHGATTVLGWRVLAAADVKIAFEDVVATDETVAVRATVTGSHRESLMDLAPTGQSFEIAYAWFCRIDDGHIDEIWSLPDGLGLLKQLGVVPPNSSDHTSVPQTEFNQS